MARTVHSLNFLNSRKLELKNDYLTKETDLPTLNSSLEWETWNLFTVRRPATSGWSGNGRIFWAKFSQDGEIIAHFVPALDPTGAPCMFDMISKKPYYNIGTNDFTYPVPAAAAADVMMLDLDLEEKFYAKMTEHGIRRLYHVPKGCTMTKDEYAAANGFKELIEPPMPLEGYWIPEWRETETQLICGWVETEPPVEEEIINNEN